MGGQNKLLISANSKSICMHSPKLVCQFSRVSIRINVIFIIDNIGFLDQGHSSCMWGFRAKRMAGGNVEFGGCWIHRRCLALQNGSK